MEGGLADTEGTGRVAKSAERCLIKINWEIRTWPRVRIPPQLGELMLRCMHVHRLPLCPAFDLRRGWISVARSGNLMITGKATSTTAATENALLYVAVTVAIEFILSSASYFCTAGIYQYPPF